LAIRFDLLVRCPAAHPHNHRAGQDRVGQVAQPGERDGAIGRNFFCLDLLAANNASPGYSTAPMPSVEQTTDFLVVLGLRTEHRVDLSSNRIVGGLASSPTLRKR
jgi:hypothetical protein